MPYYIKYLFFGLKNISYKYFGIINNIIYIVYIIIVDILSPKNKLIFLKKI